MLRSGGNHLTPSRRERDPRNWSIEEPEPLEPELGSASDVPQELGEAREHRMFPLAAGRNRARERIDSEEGPESQAQESAPIPRIRFQSFQGLRLAECDVALFLTGRPPQNRPNPLVLDGIDETVEDGEDVTLAERHLETDVLGPVVAHHSGREKP